VLQDLTELVDQKITIKSAKSNVFHDKLFEVEKIAASSKIAVDILFTDREVKEYYEISNAQKTSTVASMSNSNSEVNS
ncbi:4482_t:CDS:2, partial [Scutellospora calospora]